MNQTDLKRIQLRPYVVVALICFLLAFLFRVYDFAIAQTLSNWFGAMTSLIIAIAAALFLAELNDY